MLGGDQGFQEVVKVAFDPLAQDEAVVPGEPIRVVARSADHVVKSVDYNHFFMFLIYFPMNNYNQVL
jgi:hypothetical protein